VLTLFAVLMGIGVGAFRKISLGRTLAVSQVKDAVRAAQMFAIEQSSPARVDIDPERNTIQATGFVSTGNWHFEDDLSRGWPTNATLIGDAEIVEQGAIGRGLELGSAAIGQAELGQSASFDSDRGLLVELFCRLNEDSTGTLIQKGNAFRLSLSDTRTLVGSIRIKEGNAQSAAVEGRLVLETAETVPFGRWVRVALTYDGIALRLLIGGREQAVVRNPEQLFAEPDPTAPLMIGSVNPPLVGAVDEVRLASIVVREAPPLPDGVRLAAAGTIHFDARGRLDPGQHSKPLTISLIYDEDRRRRDIVVGLLGEVR